MGDGGDTFQIESTVNNPNPIWKSENVITTSLPALVHLVIVIAFGSRVLFYLMRPLNQPRLIADLLVGGLLSSITIGGESILVNVILPMRLVLVITTITHVGLIYYVFLTGLELNLDPVFRAQKKAATIAVAGIIIPMAMGFGIYVLAMHYDKHFPNYDKHVSSYFMWSMVLSVTSFPVLAHILADLKILYTGIGKLALAAGTISDFLNWLVFSFSVPFAVNGWKGVYSVASTSVFVLFCFSAIRPLLAKIIEKKTIKNEWDNYQLSIVVMGVFACSFVTDLLGSNPLVGALVYGLILPRGRFAEMLIEKSDEFGSGYLAPLFFVGCGIRFNLMKAVDRQGLPAVLLIVLLSCTTKIVSTVVATSSYGMPLREGAALGVLMNTKGILPLIILNLSWDKKILSPDSFTIMALAIFIMTAVVPPTINAIYKPRKLFRKNKLRTIQNSKADSEIRLLACVHNTRHATGLINILEALSGTSVSPLRVSALQLVELKGRSTGLLAAQIDEESISRHHHGGGALGLTQSHESLESITKPFYAYAEGHNYNHVETHAVVSSFETIHRDIYNLADEKQSSLVLLPFHKQSNAEGALEITNSVFRDINQNVMKDPPCSLGIFVDRGLGSSLKVNLNVLMLFIGGPDDREALAISWRMSRHPRIKLAMVRILLSGMAAEVDKSENDNEPQGVLHTVLDHEKQKDLDDEYVSSFRLMAVNNEDSITYAEKEVSSGDDIPRVLNELDQNRYDLYILGLGRGKNSKVLSDMWKWTDCPELGVIGDMVASNSFGTCASLLVVQQYGFGGMDFATNNNTEQSHEPIGLSRLL